MGYKAFISGCRQQEKKPLVKKNKKSGKDLYDLIRIILSLKPYGVSEGRVNLLCSAWTAGNLTGLPLVSTLRGWVEVG